MDIQLAALIVFLFVDLVCYAMALNMNPDVSEGSKWRFMPLSGYIFITREIVRKLRDR